jgi:hypothetical protein
MIIRKMTYRNGVLVPQSEVSSVEVLDIEKYLEELGYYVQPIVIGAAGGPHVEIYTALNGEIAPYVLLFTINNVSYDLYYFSGSDHLMAAIEKFRPLIEFYLNTTLTVQEILALISVGQPCPYHQEPEPPKETYH